MNDKTSEQDDDADASLAETLGPEIEEALLALDELCVDDPEEAISTFDTLPEPVQALVDFQLLLARAHHAIGQLEAARDILLALTSDNEENADLFHQLGDVLEDLGDLPRANQYFEKTRTLDAAALDALPTDLKREFDEEAMQALQFIAEELAPRQFSCATEPLPSAEDVVSGVDPRALSRYRASDSTLLAYSANLGAEYGDIEDDEERGEAYLFGIVATSADELGLSEDERARFEPEDDLSD